MNECYNIVVVVKVATAVRGGGLDPRTAIEGSFSAWGGLGKPNRGRDRGETDSGSDRDSDETFQISQNLGLEHVEFVCLLDSQLCPQPPLFFIFYSTQKCAPSLCSVFLVLKHLFSQRG